MNVHTRLATPADQQFLNRLNREAYEPLAVRLFGLWDDAMQRARFEDKMQRLQFRIIEVELVPTGAIASSEHADHVFLHEMMLLPELQSRGIGSLILRRELCHARAIRKPLRLHTAQLNRAQDFYRRHGFIETGRDDMFINMENAGN